MSEDSTKKRMWQFPWGYRESFIITAGLMIVGFFLEFISKGSIVQLPTWPVNLFLLVFFILYLIATYFLVKGPVMTWLSSVPAAMAGMTVFTFLILLMGFIPQGVPEGFAGKIGLNHIHTSKPYIIVTIFMLTILGYTIIRRLKLKITLKNIAFLLNHIGLFVILTAASIGSSDMLRLKMPVMEGESSNIAFPDEKHKAEMPFSLLLHSFTIEEYAPELIVFDGNSGEPVIPKGSALPKIETGSKGKILDYDFEIISFLPFAVPSEDKYLISEQYGSTHAVLLRVNTSVGIIEDWISCGNFMYQPKYMILNQKHILGMTQPKVKRYVSEVDITGNDNSIQKNVEISVNSPLKFGQWKIYQFSYNDQLGRWSEMSIFEVIRDPWLPVVYTGIFMILFGSIYLLWAGRKVEN